MIVAHEMGDTANPNAGVKSRARAAQGLSDYVRGVPECVAKGSPYSIMHISLYVSRLTFLSNALLKNVDLGCLRNVLSYVPRIIRLPVPAKV